MCRVIVLTRFRVPLPDGPAFLDDARTALDALAGQPGFLGGEVGRATDDPGLWALTTRWAGVGDYRRALSTYEVRLQAVPLLSRAVDEPSAFEVLAHPSSAGGRTARAADAGTVAVGRASEPTVPTDLDGQRAGGE